MDRFRALGSRASLRAGALALVAAALVAAGCSRAPRPEPMPGETGANAPHVPSDPELKRERAKDEDRARDRDRNRDDDRDRDDDEGEGFSQRGMASYYGSEFEGRRTASGDRYRGAQLTAAHRTLPFGTRVRVTNLANGKSVEVVINDRGPHVKGRIVDLSKRAAREIDMVRAGLARVRLEVLALAEE
jgi:rare lipoprotein A